MPLRRDVLVLEDDFTRDQVFAATAAGDKFGLVIADTSAAGAPTALCASSDSGAAVLTLAASSEVENLCLYQGDVLPFRLDKLLKVDFDVQVSGVDSVTTIVFGVGSARNDTPSSVSKYAWFRMNGATSTSAVVIGSSDGTTTRGGTAGTIATGVTLANAYKLCRIDFSYGLTDVRFFIDGARVAAGTLFDLSAAPTQQVQLIVQVQKASGTGVPAVNIGYIGVVHRV